MHAPPKATDIPTISDPTELEKYDGFLIGVPTRYGNFPGQWKVSRKWSLLFLCLSLSLSPPTSQGEIRELEHLETNLYATYPGFLGSDGQAVAVGRLLRQDGGRFRVDGGAGRRAGVDGAGDHVDLCPPRHHLRALRLRHGLRHHGRPVRGPRRHTLGAG